MATEVTVKRSAGGLYLAHPLSSLDELLSVVEGEGALSGEDVANGLTEFIELDLHGVFVRTELSEVVAELGELFEGRGEVLDLSFIECAGDEEAGCIDEVFDGLIPLVLDDLQQAYRSLTTETESAQL
jgi:hypothetical protein